MIHRPNSRNWLLSVTRNYPFTASDLYRGLPDLIEYTEIEAPPIELAADYEVYLDVGRGLAICRCAIC